MKKTLAFMAISVALVATSCSAPQTNQNAAPTTGSGIDMSSAAPTKNFLGNPDAKVVLVEFSDLQCPACKNAEPSVKSITDEFGSRIRFEYRYFPLKTIHKNAEISAYAAEAAAQQGKFWEMKAKLFQTQEEWAESNSAKELFLGYAKELGLDADKLAADMDSPSVKATVAADEAFGEKIGVNSTPSFYLNGKRLRPGSFSEFNSLVREAVLSQE
ncbi:hypothetical protein COW46_01530 [Candidatus Gracilibacteria bacterium CG17_big_fil_post_rev_8_21_14_2_50_48_13]|nr:MAG: hypothetical protein COW46_01530 [Candidatus Gracilibacteria bacterium CG17_big_fil_post_rev_8_21_14_2_50_48_13]